MAALKSYVALPGSVRAPLAHASERDPADPNQEVDVTVFLRGRTSDGPIVKDDVFSQPIQKRKLLNRNEFEQRHGADRESIARVTAFASERKLMVKEVSAARRTVILSGTVASVSAAFHVPLIEYQHPSGNFRGRSGPIHIPVDLKGDIEGIFGLDNRPQAKPHFRRLRRQGNTEGTVIRSYTPPEVAALYDFPSFVDGAGQSIAFIELGGGVNLSGLSNYFRRLNSRIPSITTVSVDGAIRGNGTEGGRPREGVMLDIAVTGSIAPGAKLIVYFGENTDAGFFNALSTAIHDTANNPSIICISWGFPECFWTIQAMAAIDQALRAAAAIGVTVCVAAGDDGASDGVDDGRAHVDFPASSPHALACGGTHLQASGNTIISESVWNQLANGNGATGGGISDSDIFLLPSWQLPLGVPLSVNGGRLRRGLPDVAGNADPHTGYLIEVGGKSDVMGGTGAVASLWSALIARINQILGQPLGYINPFLALYSSNPKGFHNITSGNNGKYYAGPGWNACTGHGTPNGTELADLFASAGEGEAGTYHAGTGWDACTGYGTPEGTKLAEMFESGGEDKAQAPPRTEIAQSAPPPAPVPPGVAPPTSSATTQKVDFTLTAPAAVAARVPFELFVWAHESHKRPQVLARAREELGARNVLARTKGPFRVSSETILSVRLRIPGAVIDEPEDTMVWEGESTCVSFVVTLPELSREAKCYGSAHVYANGVQLVRISFLLSVLGAPEGMIEASTARYRTAFASYASEDRDAVLGRIQGIQKVAPDLDIFLDVLSLRSGQEWEKELWREIPARDIFYLFWSRHARKSKWVEKEWRCALSERGIEFIDPIPLESPEKSPPPAELSSLHFNDWVLAFRRGKPCS
jgi:kumamolisin